MKKLLILIGLLASIIGVSFELSLLGSTELGGRNRPFVGARVGTLSGGISLMLEGYYPLSNFEEIENINIGEI